MKVKKFKTLFKKTSTGAIQYWDLSVHKNTIITRYGQVEGKEQETTDTIKEGKNIGKANETSPEEQALLEAQSLWEKKKKKGYVEVVKDAAAGKVDDLIEGGIFPMLAQSYSKHGDKIKWPSYVQPKLDGHRSTSDDEAKMWSRTRKLITGVPHISKEIFELALQEVILDGELYNHDYKKDFEHISHLVRQVTPIEGHEVVQFHIYDVAMEGTFKERLEWLEENIPKRNKTLKLVETRLVNNEEELIEVFEEFLKQGYEGAIVRNADGLYVNKRSYDLQKIKEFDDAEYFIVDVEEGRGKWVGVPIFTCVTETETKFKARIKGELKEVGKYLKNKKLWEGKQLTVQYQGLTGKNKVPRFPVGVRIRDDLDLPRERRAERA